MGPTRSRAITSLLAAVGAGFAVSAMTGAPIAVATHICQPGEVIKSADQCTTVPNNDATSTDGTPGKLMCNQAGHCTYFPSG
jgi:hypothetical protein